MNLVITMSRRFGTGASRIAQELSERLSVPVYDKTDIENEMHEQDFATEALAIRKLSEKPCIILGRAASEILKDKPNAFHIFVVADKQDRIKRIMEKESITEIEARERIELNDREIGEYYYKSTGKVWGDVDNYQMILDTSKLGVGNCADILIRYFERMEII